ncbi:MAG: hypothetical protein OQJ89_04710, partial [Kangiellaceae bacterium]|nr:hypothetical protein [Kangiellaceae bacterium]
MNRQRAIIDKFYNNFKECLFDDVPATHKQQLEEFQRQEFGPTSLQQNETFNDWMYAQSTDNNRIYCFHENQVIAQQSAIGAQFSACREKVSAAFAIDLRVRTEWKMKGVGVAMIGALMNRYDLLIGLGVSSEAYTMFIRQGWQDLGKLDYLFKPVSFNAFASENATILEKVKHFAVNAVSKIHNVFCSISVNSFRLAKIDKVPPSADKQCLEFQLEYNTSLRDSSYLNWRYAENALKSNDRIYQILDNKEEPKGLLVLKEVTRDRKKLVYISEIIASSKNYSKIVSLIIREAENLKADRIIFHGRDDIFVSCLKKKLFIARSYGARFVYYCSDVSLSK